MKRLELRQELALVVLAFGLALLVSTGVLLPNLVTATEDEVFGKQLAVWSAEAEARLDAHDVADEATTLGPGLTLHPSPAALTPALATWLTELPPGTHELNDEALAGIDAQEVFVVVFDRSPRAWLVWDVGPFEAFEGPWPARYAVPIVGGSLLAAFGTAVGLWVLARVVRALRQLSEIAATSAEDLEPEPLAAERRSDEIGAIAHRWRASLERTRAALDRERAFARDASHELRTPLTAARGAVELLEGADDPGQRAAWSRRALGSLDEAERRVATFLWLAREERPLEPEPWPLAPLIEERAPGATLRLDANVETDVAEAAVRVVLDSLIANAAQHGTGSLEVELTSRALTLSNPLSDENASAGGHGFGLRLVGDLCARLGWRLWTAAARERFTATIEF